MTYYMIRFVYNNIISLQAYQDPDPGLKPSNGSGWGCKTIEISIATLRLTTRSELYMPREQNSREGIPGPGSRSYSKKMDPDRDDKIIGVRIYNT